MSEVLDSKDTDIKIPHSLATRLLENINKDGLVCVDDILSVEAQAGHTLFPAKLHNRLTTHKTSMGVHELLRYVRNNTQEHVDLSQQIHGKLSRVVTRLYNSDTDSILADLFNELKILESRYLPKSIQDSIMVNSNMVSDVPVSHFCKDGALYNNIDFSDSRIARYLGRYSSPVPFAVLSRIAYSISDDIDIYDARSSSLTETVAFSGTMREYILGHIFIIQTFTKDALNNYRKELADSSRYILYPCEVKYPTLFSTWVDEAVVKDNMIINFLD